MIYSGNQVEGSLRLAARNKMVVSVSPNDTGVGRKMAVNAAVPAANGGRSQNFLRGFVADVKGITMAVLFLQNGDRFAGKLREKVAVLGFRGGERRRRNQGRWRSDGGGEVASGGSWCSIQWLGYSWNHVHED